MTSKILVKIRVKHNLPLSDRCISFSQITADHLFYLRSLKAKEVALCELEYKVIVAKKANKRLLTYYLYLGSR